MHLEFPPKPLPKLAFWLFERGIPRGLFAERIGRKRQQVDQYCLPFDNPDRDIPVPAVMEQIVELTGGQVTPADFYPPHLNGEAAATAEAGERQLEPVQ